MSICCYNHQTARGVRGHRLHKMLWGLIKALLILLQAAVVDLMWLTAVTHSWVTTPVEFLFSLTACCAAAAILDLKPDKSSNSKDKRSCFQETLVALTQQTLVQQWRVPGQKWSQLDPKNGDRPPDVEVFSTFNPGPVKPKYWSNHCYVFFF